MPCVTEVVEVVEFVAQASTVLADLLNTIPTDGNKRSSSGDKKKRANLSLADPQSQAQEIVTNSTTSSANDFLKVFKYTYAGNETAPPNLDPGKAILPGQTTLVMKTIADIASITTYIQQTFKVSNIINNSDMNNFAQETTTWLSNSLTTPNLWVQRTTSKQFLGSNNDTIEYDVQFTAVYVNDTQNNISFYLLTYTSCIYGANVLFGSTGFEKGYPPATLYNVEGSTDDPKIDGKTWIQLLRDNGINGSCYVMNTSVVGNHSLDVVGGHMTANDDGSVTNGECYLMPLCREHNKKSHDRQAFSIDSNNPVLLLSGYMKGATFETFMKRAKLGASIKEEFVYFYKTNNWKILYADVPNLISKSYPFICYSLNTRTVVNKRIDNFDDLYAGFFEFILSSNNKSKF